jgi:hypothetical protein
LYNFAETQGRSQSAASTSGPVFWLRSLEQWTMEPDRSVSSSYPSGVYRERERAPVLCVCVCWEPEGMRPRRCGVIRYYLENHVIPSRRTPTSFLSRFAAIVSRSTRLLPRVHMEWKANVTRNILSPSYASSRRVGVEVLRRILEGGEIGGEGEMFNQSGRECCPYALCAISLDQFCSYITTASTADSV